MARAAAPRLPPCARATVGLLLLAGCGDDAAGEAAWGTFDPALRINVSRIRCDSGRFVGPVSLVAAGDTGPIEDLRLLRWDLAEGRLSDEGRAERVGTSFTVDAAEIACDGAGAALVVVPVGETSYGTPELEVSEAGVLNGGGARATSVPITLVVSEVGERAASVTAYVYDLTGDAALTPIPLQRSAPGTWDAAWNGTLQPGFLMGALAYDAGGTVIGTFGL